VRERRGSLVAAVILAAFGACVATPAAQALADAHHWPLGLALLVIAGALLAPAYLATSMVARDAQRLSDRAAARRARLEYEERRLASLPLPFEVDGDTFERLVEAEVAALPAWVLEAIRMTGTRIEIDDQLAGHPFVLGLFSRRPVGAPSRVGGGATVDSSTVITLFRTPLIRAAGMPSRLRTQVRETLLHEVGHLLGMDEGDLDRFSIGNHPRPDAAVVPPRTLG
jgi:predicted Zn-dependent protease with MMP-like domain